MLRVLSLNLQHGAIGEGAAQASALSHQALAGQDVAHPPTAQAALEALAEQVSELTPDVLVLQEVDHHQHRSAGLDQTAVLARLLDMRYHRFAAAWAGPVVGLRRRPHGSALRDPSDEPLGPLRAAVGLPLQGFGNAIISRHPVEAWRVQRLERGAPSWTLRGPAWDPRSYRLWTASARVLLAATIRLGDGADQKITVGATHLATNTTTARRQLADTWRALVGLPGPHVLAGDMNLREHQVAALGLARLVGTGHTYPVGKPDHRIDHFLTDPWPTGPDGLPDPTGQDILRAVGWGTRSFVLSDHAGTWVDLEPLA
ncbi:endonuclease/exonuclease/phosphatase family protein [Actinomyces trachealis]|uniref:endonuclease/exonuclease/phosphatase family protein n=1 Tax=Actinomyces trachealis TaxID=2763540 RepID=UPI001892D1CD|nr:endonuclease/exonuclease/phosphatase family protein [Actinomyces trachealis]